MNVFRILLALVIASAAHAEAPVSNKDLVKVVGKLDALTRVTEQRYSMRARYVDLCGLVDAPDHARLIGKDFPEVHVYVSPGGANAFKEKAAVFPVGSIVLKQKFASAEAKHPELYTGMLKREKGFNPNCGDWEFFTMTGDGKGVTSRG